MWLWLGAVAEAATPVVHRCSIPAYAVAEACDCLAADPEGPKWWGAVGNPVEARGCFLIDDVMAASPTVSRLRDPLEALAMQVAHAHGYTLSFGRLVSQDDKEQLSGLLTWVPTVGGEYELVDGNGKEIAPVDPRGRIPWFAAWIDGEGALTEGDEDRAKPGPADDLITAFADGEVWIVLAPLGDPIVFPKP